MHAAVMKHTKFLLYAFVCLFGLGYAITSIVVYFLPRNKLN